MREKGAKGGEEKKGRSKSKTKQTRSVNTSSGRRALLRTVGRTDTDKSKWPPATNFEKTFRPAALR